MKDFLLKILKIIKNITFHISFTLTTLIRWLSKTKRWKIDMTFDVIEEEEKHRKEENKDEDNI